MGQKVQGFSFSSTAKDAPELATLQGLVATSSRVCCVAAASSHTLELAAVTQQAGAREASELATLQQQASFGACCVATASKQASEPEILQSLLRCNSKQAPELLKNLQRSSGACCVAAARKLAPEPKILRSLLRSNNKQAPELPELGACWPSSRLRRSPELEAF